MADLDKLNIKVEVEGGSEAESQLQSLIDKLKAIQTLQESTGLGKSFDALTTKIAEAEIRLEQLEGQIERCVDTLGSLSSKGLDNVKESITQTAKASEELAETIPDAIGGFQEGGAKGLDETVEKTKEATQSINESSQEASKLATTVAGIKEGFGAVAGAVGMVVGVLKTAVGIVKTIYGTIKKIVSAVVQVSTAIGKVATMPFTPVIKGMQTVYESIAKVIRQITKMVKMRLFRLIAKSIIGGFTEGLRNAYDWAKTVGNEFANSMDSIATSSLYLKNSLGAMASPLLNVLAPAIDFIVDKFVGLLNVVNQVIARLTGRSTWIKALKVPQEFAGGLDNATGSAKALEKELITILGIDEINPLERANDSPSGGGGGGGISSGASSMFTEETITNDANEWARKIKEAWENADFTEIGRIIGDKLNNALESIPWEKIKETAKKIGSSIATFLNGAMATPNLFTNIGKTIAEALNTAFTFAYGFVTKFDWKNFGKAVTDGINGFMKTLDWQTIKTTVNTTMKGLGDALMSAVRNLKWTGEGSISRTLANGINTSVSGVLSFIKTVDWSEVASKVSEGINGLFDDVDWEALEELVSEGIKAVLSFLETLKQKVHWKEIGKQIHDALIGGIKEALGISPNENFAVWLLKKAFGKTLDMTTLGQGIKLFRGTPDIGGASAEIEAWTGKPVTVDAKLNYIGDTNGKYQKNLLRKGINGLWSIFGTTNVPSELGSNWDITKTTSIPPYVGSQWKQTGMLDFPAYIGSDWYYTGNQAFPSYIGSDWYYTGNQAFPSYMQSGWEYNNQYTKFPTYMKSGWERNGLKNFPTWIGAGWERNGYSNFPKWIGAGWERDGLKGFTWIPAGWNIDDYANAPSWVKAMWGITKAVAVTGTIAGLITSAIARGNAEGGVFRHGKWHDIPQYATGGSPSHGSLFWAGESGSELVGHIGGRTEVLNQSQLASTMYSSVLSANASQNRLLQEQNNLLRELIGVSGDSRTVVSVGDIIDGFSQRNRRDGRTVMAVGV